MMWLLLIFAVGVPAGYAVIGLVAIEGVGGSEAGCRCAGWGCLGEVVAFVDLGDESGVGWCPSQELLGEGAGGGHVDAE